MMDGKERGGRRDGAGHGGYRGRYRGREQGVEGKEGNAPGEFNPSFGNEFGMCFSFLSFPSLLLRRIWFGCLSHTDLQAVVVVRVLLDFRLDQPSDVVSLRCAACELV